MLLKALTPILLDNAQDLAQRLAQLGADLLVELLERRKFKFPKKVSGDLCATDSKAGFVGLV